MNNRHHIIPVGDTKQHNTNGPNCWCHPTTDELLIIHNAADGREFYQEDELEWLAMQSALDMMVADLPPHIRKTPQ